MYKYIYRFLALLLVVISPTTLFAQREFPGGVGNVQVWLKPDNNTIKTLSQGSNQVDRWDNDPYATGRSVVFSYDVAKTSASAYKKLRPTLIKGSYKMNFNDALFFGNDHYLASARGVEGSTGAITVIAIYIAEKETGAYRMYYTGFGGVTTTNADSRKPAVGFSPRFSGGRVRGGADYDGDGGYVKNTTALQVTTIQSGASNVSYTKFRFNGADFSSNSKDKDIKGPTAGYFKVADGITLGGASIKDANGGPFGGQLAEYIVYNRALSFFEITKIESYLATKYGITLDGAAYTSSRGTQFWPFGRTGIGYHNNVAGIFRDSGSTNISVSRSTAAGAALTVNTIGTYFAPGYGVGTSVPLPNDNAAIYWGSNTGSGISSPANTQGCDYSFILRDKLWKFQKTNLGNTTVEVRAGGEDFAYSGPGYEVRMLVAKTEADAYANNWMAVIPGQYVGGELNEHLFKLPIDQSELYITFGAKLSLGSCPTCKTNIAGEYKFSSRTWSNGTKNVNNLVASNGIKFNVGYKTYNNNVETSSMQLNGYPRVSNGTLLESKFKGVKGSNNSYSETNITFNDGATFAKFKIFGIDKNSNAADEVEITGYCGNVPYAATVSYNTNDDKKKTFTIGGKIINGTKTSSITNRSGAAIIEFPHEVTRIVIKHKIQYRTNSRGYQNIAIGDFELNCPRPANPNPDGIEFTLQAPPKVVSCADFYYTLKIWNYACDARYVKIEDELPEGIFWVEEGVSSSEFALKDAVFNNYKNTRVLSIDKVKLLPGSYTTITARVRFKDDAVSKVYENRGKLTYSSVNEGKVITIESCDYNSFDTCVSTKTEMTYQPRVLSPQVTIEADIIRCYRETGVITLKAKIKNPNSTVDFTNVSASLTYNEEFIFKSFKSTGGQGTATKDDGIYNVDGLNVKGGSTLELTYEIQALEFLSLIEAVTGKKYTNPRDVTDADIAMIANFGAVIEIIGNSEDVCINESLEDVYAVLDPTIPFCGRSLSCYYPGLPGKVVKKNSDFVLMTTLDRSGGVTVTSENINAILYLESKTKGFVPTRLSENQINTLANPIAGMMVYDTTNKCMKLYNGKLWSCIVQSCPDN